jgi:hypothetical protein
MKTAHLGEVFNCFEGRVVCADDAKYVMKGKPAPDVFLTAAKELLGRDVGIPGERCTDTQEEERASGLVFEDAIPGFQAGKRAGMSGTITTFLLVYNADTPQCSGMGSGPCTSQRRIFRRGKTRSDTRIDFAFRARGVGVATL